MAGFSRGQGVPQHRASTS